MADLIDRQTIIETIHSAIYPYFCGAEDGDALSKDEKLVLSVNKAVCTAIKALPSAQPDVPVGDMISRQAAIDTVRSYYDECDEREESIEERIERLPSADTDLSNFSDKLWKTAYERGKAEAVRWISCSERLPAKKTEVIYSLENHYVSTGYMTDRDYNGNETELHWEDMESGALIYPEAWMPLPEPWKGGQDDQGISN